MEIKRFCSFCDKQEDDVKVLFQGESNVSICDNCITAFSEIMENNNFFQNSNNNGNEK